MTLLIPPDVTRRVLTMDESLDAIEDAFTQLGEGNATYQPRTDVWSPTATEGDYYRWGSLIGAIRDPPRFSLRFKSDVVKWGDDGTEQKFNVTPGRLMWFVLLFDTSTGDLLAKMNDAVLQHYRVAATAGVACKHLARADSETVGLLGSGGMARTYLAAFASVRDLTDAKVFSPTVEHREQFADEMGDELDVTVRAVDSAEEAMGGVDIAATCTNARNPVFEREWLEPGTFLTNARHGEMRQDTYDAVDRVVTTSNDSFFEYVLGSGEERDRRPLHADYRRRYEQLDYPTLAELLVGEEPGRRDDDETVLYHNDSAGIQFTAVGNLVYEKARERGLGTPIPLEWYQQDTGESLSIRHIYTGEE